MTLNLRYDQGRIRKYHYFMLLSLIQKYKKISRSQLAKLTKMSNTSVGKIIKNLIDDELVIEAGQTDGEIGRRAALLEINPIGSFIIGVEMDKNGVKIAIVTLTGEVIRERQFAFDPDQEPYRLLDKLGEEITILLSKMDSSINKKIIAIGISIPGLITWPEGKALRVPQFHWENINIKAYLEEKLDFVVYVDNHVRTVLLAESLYGNMRNYNNSVCIYIGSGVGGAAMVNGEMLRGHRNTLGEIGHMILDPHGTVCDCGRLGCLQTFICSSELEKQAQMPMQEIFSAYKEREDWAVKLINRAQSYLGLAISNVICIYNPEAILIAGPMIEEFPILIDNIQDEVNKYIWAPLSNSFHLVYPEIGRSSGVIGASALVLNEFLRFTNDDV
ncbi:ROK family protein [Gracilibacillus alcaliphilus]|uniref:ROK family protein n=1 Tax=Gracilibacillus alcaliphilus TaxID=1401441 RepID=UPI001958DA82|nr:ROK family protein [Gracilibacillus alcaliphilus]MBM7676831.1 putative NBD/HSP70 family sugar kinase/biotin operon repressor [Gracilibacillus alcaliphilus]